MVCQSVYPHGREDQADPQYRRGDCCRALALNSLWPPSSREEHPRRTLFLNICSLTIS